LVLNLIYGELLFGIDVLLLYFEDGFCDVVVTDDIFLVLLMIKIGSPCF
jgi:hypothetical protein